jgi:hypothetical protein
MSETASRQTGCSDCWLPANGITGPRANGLILDIKPLFVLESRAQFPN